MKPSLYYVLLLTIVRIFCPSLRTFLTTILQIRFGNHTSGIGYEYYEITISNMTAGSYHYTATLVTQDSFTRPVHLNVFMGTALKDLITKTVHNSHFHKNTKCNLSLTPPLTIASTTLHEMMAHKSNSESIGQHFSIFKNNTLAMVASEALPQYKACFLCS